MGEHFVSEIGPDTDGKHAERSNETTLIYVERNKTECPSFPGAHAAKRRASTCSFVLFNEHKTQTSCVIIQWISGTVWLIQPLMNLWLVQYINLSEVTFVCPYYPVLRLRKSDSPSCITMLFCNKNYNEMQKITQSKVIELMQVQ